MSGDAEHDGERRPVAVLSGDPRRSDGPDGDETPDDRVEDRTGEREHAALDARVTGLEDRFAAMRLRIEEAERALHAIGEEMRRRH